MIPLILCILASTSLLVIFRILEKYNTQTFPVIVVNYLVATLTGLLLLEEPRMFVSMLDEPWVPYSIFLGTMFIIVFNLIGLSARFEGITITAIAHKLSLVIPIVAAYFMFGEVFGILKTIGIVLALVAVVFSSFSRNKPAIPKKGFLLVLPLLVFLGSGVVDSTVKYVEHHFLGNVGPEHQTAFNIMLFALAFIIGALVLVVQLIRGKARLGWREIGFGILLGVPNYFSIHFMLNSLKLLQSSAVFPIVNVAVVLLSTAIGFVFFKERSTPLKIAGLILAVVAIALIIFSEWQQQAIEV